MNIEEIIIEYFNRQDVALDAPTFGEIPEKPPGEYYIVELIGGANTDHINQSTVAIQSYADSRARAADLAFEADNAMRLGLIEVEAVSGVHRNTVANYTDQSTRKYRYQGVYVVNHY